METVLPKQVGRVVIDVITKKPDAPYSDHEAEGILLKLFSGGSVAQRRRKLLSNNPTWPLYYHLSPRRANLFRWYDFKDNARVLEVGAGPGAITEELTKHNIRVTALELTRKRALINAHRNSNASNLEIVVGNLNEYMPKVKFDYVVVVGVLEYAGTFFSTDSPYTSFLDKIQSLLSPKGRLLLAIENRFGLKYWAGAKEDHTHTFFEGHNGYPSHKRVQTFGKTELVKLLVSANFKNTNFYYPFPDYKHPSFIFSESYYPGNGTIFPLGALPAPTYDRPREYFFSEQSVMRYIEENGLFPDLSNSFFVEASK